MELGTFIFENSEMNLGEASEAYSRYPQVRTDFDKKLLEYEGAVAALSRMNPVSIAVEQEERVDRLAEETEQLHQECKILKAVLSSKAKGMIEENTGLEKDLSCHTAFIKEDDVEFCLSLHSEAVQLLDNDEIMGAIEKACQARESFTGLLFQAKKMWIEKHLQKADEMNKESI
ncbi:MAG TPA: hypothetical protein ENG83_13020 [Nitrospirae bacterium]|nr:hypothetical protein BMS3Abin06_00711 [bacterium BMS3Abin06]HDH13099.1 hypothetical protein [Nitrospirota bacterium]HDZ02113.1 hypothetical protein [Nitrospirota bacterium]